MGDITSKKPAATFESILKIGTGDNQNVDTTLRVVEDGTGVASALYLATDSALISGNGIKLYFYDADGGEHISADNAGDLTIAAGTALNITADIIDLSDATKAITLNAAANALNFDSNSLSSLHGTFPDHTNANDGWIRIEINGVTKWIPFFATPA